MKTHTYDIWSMDHGEAIVQLPTNYSSVEVDELEQWFALIVRYRRRCAHRIESQRVDAMPAEEPNNGA